MEKSIIHFFSKMGFYDKEYFEIIKRNTTIVNEDYEKIIDLVGFYPKIFKLVLPKIKNYRDILIWIHEYAHALFPDDTDEIFPNLMEAYFINMFIDDKNIVNRLIEKTKEEINNSSDLDHIIAKKIKLNTITRNKML